MRRIVDAIVLGVPDDGDGVGEIRMIGAGAQDQEPFALQPFDGHAAVHGDTRHRGMSGFRRPPADEAAEEL